MATTEDRRAGARANPVVAFLKRRWLAIVLVLLAIVFIVQNRNDSTVQLFNAQATMSQWLVLSIVFVGGMVAGFIMARNKRR